MTTRVSAFNPNVLLEMRRMMVRSNSDNSPASLVSVKKNLFGPIDHEEAQSFVDRELAAMKKRDNDKWGFDFEKETPLENSRFAWERITPQKLTLYAWLGQRGDSKELADKVSTNTTTGSQVQPAQTDKSAKQSHITDFMKCRKRSLSVGDISRQKVGNVKEDAVNSGTIASLLKPSKTKRSRTRQHQ